MGLSHTCFVYPWLRFPSQLPAWLPLGVPGKGLRTQLSDKMGITSSPGPGCHSLIGVILVQEDDLRLRAWVSEATLQKKAGHAERALELLRRAARLEPKVGAA